jgi:hypothetical protein
LGIGREEFHDGFEVEGAIAFIDGGALRAAV